MHTDQKGNSYIYTQFYGAREVPYIVVLICPLLVDVPPFEVLSLFTVNIPKIKINIIPSVYS